MKTRFFLSIMVAAVCLGCRGSHAQPLSNAEINAALFRLPSLPKVHYYWPPSSDLLENRNARRLYDLVRITHTCCVFGEWTNQRQVDNAVYQCSRVNRTSPEIPASMGVLFLPWHRRFGKELPATDRGPTYSEEIAYFRQRAKQIRQWVEQSNQTYGGDIQVTAIIHDSERFSYRANDPEHNKGMQEALDAIHEQTIRVFPEAHVIWYGRGMVLHPRTGKPKRTPYWTGLEISPLLTCSLYNLPEPERMHTTFRETCLLADQMGIAHVVPFVALAAGYKRNAVGRTWLVDWPFDPTYSWAMGAALNGRSDDPSKNALYARAPFVVFYPPPFDKRAPEWPRHFIAYVHGATGLSESAPLP